LDGLREVGKFRIDSGDEGGHRRRHSKEERLMYPFGCWVKSLELERLVAGGRHGCCGLGDALIRW
jgi:hypothetical protein